jgi:hypothetical protein
MKTTTAAGAYGFKGTDYCVECVECDSPCLGEEEKARTVRHEGVGRCGCCGGTFAVTVDVVRYFDGEVVGTTTLTAEAWERYAACEHAAYEWPAGVARAGDVLTEDELEAMGLDGKTTIYLEK